MLPLGEMHGIINFYLILVSHSNNCRLFVGARISFLTIWIERHQNEPMKLFSIDEKIPVLILILPTGCWETVCYSCHVQRSLCQSSGKKTSMNSTNFIWSHVVRVVFIAALQTTANLGYTYKCSKTKCLPWCGFFLKYFEWALICSVSIVWLARKLPCYLWSPTIVRNHPINAVQSKFETNTCSRREAWGKLVRTSHDWA